MSIPSNTTVTVATGSSAADGDTTIPESNTTQISDWVTHRDGLFGKVDEVICSGQCSERTRQDLHERIFHLRRPHNEDWRQRNRDSDPQAHIVSLNDFEEELSSQVDEIYKVIQGKNGISAGKRGKQLKNWYQSRRTYILLRASSKRSTVNGMPSDQTHPERGRSLGDKLLLFFSNGEKSEPRYMSGK